MRFSVIGALVTACLLPSLAKAQSLPLSGQCYIPEFNSGNRCTSNSPAFRAIAVEPSATRCESRYLQARPTNNPVPIHRNHPTQHPASGVFQSTRNDREHSCSELNREINRGINRRIFEGVGYRGRSGQRLGRLADALTDIFPVPMGMIWSLAWLGNTGIVLLYRRRGRRSTLLPQKLEPSLKPAFPTLRLWDG